MTQRRSVLMAGPLSVWWDEKGGYMMTLHDESVRLKKLMLTADEDGVMFAGQAHDGRLITFGTNDPTLTGKRIS